MAAISLILLPLLFVAIFGENSTLSKEVYTTKYDDVDLDEILRSDRLLLNYVNCLMNKGHCTPDGLELKKNLPDAIDNDCKKCSEKQRVGSAQVMHHLIDQKPDMWNELEKLYNPSGSYKAAYLKDKPDDQKE